MEIAIIVGAALAALIIIDTGYWIAFSLIRWSPVIVAGVLAFWIAQHHGAERLDALGVACLASLATRHVMRTCYICGDNAPR